MIDFWFRVQQLRLRIIMGGLEFREELLMIRYIQPLIIVSFDVLICKREGNGIVDDIYQ